jgi:hypothetical protein
LPTLQFELKAHGQGYRTWIQSDPEDELVLRYPIGAEMSSLVFANMNNRTLKLGETPILWLWPQTDAGKDTFSGVYYVNFDRFGATLHLRGSKDAQQQWTFRWLLGEDSHSCSCPQVGGVLSDAYTKKWLRLTGNPNVAISENPSVSIWDRLLGGDDA